MPHKFACKKGLPSATINKTSVNLMMSCTIGDNPVGLSPESITKSLIHQVSFGVSCHSRSLKSLYFSKCQQHTTMIKFQVDLIFDQDKIRQKIGDYFLKHKIEMKYLFLMFLL